MTTFNTSSNIGNPTFNYDVNARTTVPGVNTNPTYSNTYDVTGNRGTVGTNVSPLDPNVRISTNYSPNANQVNVPVTGTTSSNFAPGTIAASTLNRYTTSPPTGNVQTSGHYSTYNSYSNPININTAATGPAAPTTHITTSGYNAQPNNIIKTTIENNVIRTSTNNNAIRSSQQNYDSHVGAQPTGTNPRNLAGASSVHASAGSKSWNWKTLGLIGLGLLALTGVILGLLFGLHVIGDQKKNADFNPDDNNTTVTTQTTVVNGTSANTTTTTNGPTFPTFNTPTSTTNGTTPTNGTTTNGTTTPNTTNTTNTTNSNTTAPTTAGQTITYPTNSTTGTTSVTTNGTTSGTTNGTSSGTTSGTTTVSTTATTTPTSGTTATGTTTIAQPTPTFTLVIPKHNLMRKYVD